MNASPTERTPGAGRHEYFSAGIASASARNLLCSVSRSVMNCLRMSSAASRFGTPAPSCAAAAVPVEAARPTASISERVTVWCGMMGLSVVRTEWGHEAARLRIYPATAMRDPDGTNGHATGRTGGGERRAVRLPGRDGVLKSTTEARRARRRGTRGGGPPAGTGCRTAEGEPRGGDPFQRSSHLLPREGPLSVCTNLRALRASVVDFNTPSRWRDSLRSTH